MQEIRDMEKEAARLAAFDAERLARYSADDEKRARAAGWFPTREAHTMFRNGDPFGVCRPLVGGDKYQSETDSYMSVPLRHADDWYDACEMDKLK